MEVIALGNKWWSAKKNTILKNLETEENTRLFATKKEINNYLHPQGKMIIFISFGLFWNIYYLIFPVYEKSRWWTFQECSWNLQRSGQSAPCSFPFHLKKDVLFPSSKLFIDQLKSPYNFKNDNIHWYLRDTLYIPDIVIADIDVICYKCLFLWGESCNSASYFISFNITKVGYESYLRWLYITA